MLFACVETPHSDNTNWQTESHRLRENFMVQRYLLGLQIVLIQSLRKSKAVFTTCDKDAVRDIRTRAEFWKRLDRRLIVADWHDIENKVAREVHVKRFEPKELGLKTSQDAFSFIAPMVSSNKKDTHNVKPCGSSLHFGRGER